MISERRLFLVILLLCALAACHAHTVVHIPLEENGHVYAKGEITGEVVWSGKVYINTKVTVRRGGRLIIKPGTNILFRKLDTTGDGHGNAGIVINSGGFILAKGEYNKRIVFTSLEKKPARNDWNRIDLKKGSKGRFYQCDFKYSSWSFHFHDADIVIDHCVFSQNTGCVKFRGGNVYISNNEFVSNGIGVRFWYSDAKIEGNHFKNNDIALVFGSECEKSFVRNNNFINNKFNVRLRPEHKTNLNLIDNYWGTEIFHKVDEKALGLVNYVPYYKHAIRMP